jgi:hypothetical protein
MHDNQINKMSTEKLPRSSFLSQETVDVNSRWDVLHGHGSSSVASAILDLLAIEGGECPDIRRADSNSSGGGDSKRLHCVVLLAWLGSFKDTIL